MLWKSSMIEVSHYLVTQLPNCALLQSLILKLTFNTQFKFLVNSWYVLILYGHFDKCLKHSLWSFYDITAFLVFLYKQASIKVVVKTSWIKGHIVLEATSGWFFSTQARFTSWTFHITFEICMKYHVKLI